MPQTISRTNKQNPIPPTPKKKTSNVVPIEQYGRFDHKMSDFRQFMDWREPVKACTRVPNKDREKIVVISDPHCPLLHKEAFRECLRRDGDADVCIVAGDVSDNTAFSTFAKFHSGPTHLEQLEETTEFLVTLSKTFPKVLVIPGNHDFRQKKAMAKMFEQSGQLEFLGMCEGKYPGLTSWLDWIIPDLPNVSMAHTSSYQDAEFCFFMQYGDMIVGHAETYSKIEARTVTNFARWLQDVAVYYGLVKPYSVVCNGHSHMAGMVKGAGGKVLCDLGCMCRYPEYGAGPKCRTPRPWGVGYFTFVQYGGETDLSNILWHDLSHIK